MHFELIIIVIILVYIFSKSNENYSSIISSNDDTLITSNSILTSLFNTTNNNYKKELTNDNFDIYIIHMETNTNRLLNFNRYYNISDLVFKKYNIFPAVIGKNLNLIDFVTPKAYEQILLTDKTKKKRFHYELTRGAVGCYLSHLSVYKKIIESNLKYGIVFEDDSIIANDFYDRLQYGLSVVPQDWDIYLLGLICLKCDINKDYININRFWGTHGYIIKKDSAKKILEYLDRPISKQIDADLSLLIKRKIINVYAINPIIVAQDGTFISDIQIDTLDSVDAFNEEFKQQELMNFYAKNKVFKVK